MTCKAYEWIEPDPCNSRWERIIDSVLIGGK